MDLQYRPLVPTSYTGETPETFRRKVNTALTSEWDSRHGQSFRAEYDDLVKAQGKSRRVFREELEKELKKPETTDFLVAEWTKWHEIPRDRKMTLSASLSRYKYSDSPIPSFVIRLRDEVQGCCSYTLVYIESEEEQTGQDPEEGAQMISEGGESEEAVEDGKLKSRWWFQLSGAHQGHLRNGGAGCRSNHCKGSDFTSSVPATTSGSASDAVPLVSPAQPSLSASGTRDWDEYLRHHGLL